MERRSNGRGALERIITKQSRRINAGVPRRRGVEKLLDEEKPSVPTRDGGGEHRFDRENLERASEAVSTYRRRLRLPVFLHRKPSVRDEFRVDGELECAVAKEFGELGEYETTDGTLWIPQSIGFGLHSEFNDVFQVVLLP